MTLLDIRGLNVYYGESHILRSVDLTVAPGEMVCLIGRNGVGKTTLLKTVIGLLQQRSGDLLLELGVLALLPVVALLHLVFGAEDLGGQGLADVTSLA